MEIIAEHDLQVLFARYHLYPSDVQWTGNAWIIQHNGNEYRAHSVAAAREVARQIVRQMCAYGDAEDVIFEAENGGPVRRDAFFDRD